MPQTKNETPTQNAPETSRKETATSKQEPNQRAVPLVESRRNDPHTSQDAKPKDFPSRQTPTFWGPNDKKKSASHTSALGPPTRVSQENNLMESTSERIRDRHSSAQTFNDGSVDPETNRHASATPDSPHRKGLRRNTPPTTCSQSQMETETKATNFVQKRAMAYALPENEGEPDPNSAADSSQPGAYSGTPGRTPQRRDDLDFSVMGVPAPISRQQSNPSMGAVLTNQEEEEIVVDQNSTHDERDEHENRIDPNDANEGLVVAQPVNEELPQAEEVNKDSTNKMERDSISLRKRKQRINIVAATLVVLVVVILVLVFVLRNDGNGDETDKVATPRGEYLQQFLANETLSQLESPSSAQSRAFLWLAEDPSLYDYPEWRIQQRYALATFYYSTNGENWRYNTDWLAHSVHECEWYHRSSFGLLGVDVSKGISSSATCQDGIYQHLWLYTNEVEGSLPFELFEMLPSLRTISLHANELSGTLPSSIGKLSELEAISLANTNMLGAIPSEIGLLKNLTYLILLANQLESTIPTEIGNMESLKSLTLDGNNIDGTICTELGRLTSLTRLYLQRNNLTGELPSELGLVSSLEELQIQDNFLKGSISGTLGSLYLLRMFIAENNLLSGPIPDQIGGMRALVDLDLQGNRISGTIPSMIGQLNSLEHLYLSGNNMSGVIPTEVGMLTSLKTLLLFNNLEVRSGAGLNGPIPSELGQLWDLNHFLLFGNAVSGAIPTALGALTKLQHLVLGQNRLIGTIPSELSNLSNLEELDLSSNELSGGISSGLGLLSKITSLDLGYNLLSGETILLGRLVNLDFLGLQHNLLTQFSHTWDLPESLSHLLLSDNAFEMELPLALARLRRMRALGFDSNQLSGNIPSELGLLPNLEILKLGSNKITGTIPSEVFHWRSLREVSLKSNQLTGPIPLQLSNPTNLEFVDLSRNKLTGSMPWIGILTSLQSFDLSHNQLIGWLPEGIGQLTSLRLLRLENNAFSGTIPNELEFLSRLEGLYLGNNLLSGQLIFSDDIYSASTEGDSQSAAPRAFTLPWWMIIASPGWWGAAQISKQSDGASSLLDIFDENEVVLPSSWNNINVSLLGVEHVETSTFDIGHKLKYLFLHNNSLRGGIPTKLATLTDLQEIILDDNRLTGSIPAEIGQLSNLKTFSAGGQNFLTPDLVSLAFSGLKTFHATFDRYVGSVPLSFCDIASLRLCWNSGSVERVCSCSCHLDISTCADN